MHANDGRTIYIYIDRQRVELPRWGSLTLAPIITLTWPQNNSVGSLLQDVYSVRELGFPDTVVCIFIFKLLFYDSDS